MDHYHLAEVNIAKRLAPMDDPIMQDFVNNVDKMNAIADASEGFIWRLKDEDKDEAIFVFKDDSIIINLSVWENLDALFNYTYKSGHIEVFKRKKEWFSKMKLMHMAFWYVPKGYEPTFQDAKHRLDYLNTYGDTPYAFSFKNKFSLAEALTYKKQL
ncbi:DUF3291 domain-containing protein [Algibacter amylolyticus]|uniref:DUF3291 domain-containing protein n=1 Tax=Algibacter amylolyticus TaxID=1608400 RepID=A0A5M7AU93_9FLAO|nr:DUF3291 domain-containing protein [Algibacter amylolyticus]KAA5821133.1 DUF3291 domain-containing protein [Algibacter amylolyticus]MBB5269778.1 hypothetical protein [Algibacter amylolyticus]TSJ72079.1 DUF3291 domain-containing protein [Algibacter amylolyticus]